MHPTKLPSEMSAFSLEPAQRELVHQLVDWGLVEHRCQQYPAIARAFPLKLLQKRHDSPPYYCHYMAWRLGTWDDDSLLHRIDELLCCAERLPDWVGERQLLASTDFAEFWSLLWQLQVAEHLSNVGTDVRWARSGPDLSITLNGERIYIECYTPRKSFGLLLFLEELLWRLDSSLRVSYDLCLPFQLPQNAERTNFLHEVLSRFLAPAYLDDARKSSATQHPVVLYKHPSSSLYVYLEGQDADAYAPLVVPNAVGDPRSYLKQALREAVSNKANSNKLRDHHPNLLVVNYVLSQDYQLAMSSPRIPQDPSKPFLGTDLDALAISVIGIDEKLTKEKLIVIGFSHAAHRETLAKIGSFA